MIEFSSTLMRLETYSVNKAVFDVCENMVSGLKGIMPSSLQSIFQISGFGEWGGAWSYLQTQKAMVDGLFNGFAICFPAAFLVLVMTTGSIPTAIYAVITVAGIVTFVLGFVSGALGFPLGLVECIAAVIVVGFSVDYTVHLAHMYHVCPAPDHTSRVNFAVLHMGGTVLAGAITTFGAGLPLFFGILSFFPKMGALIVCTIISSYFLSMCFFVPCLVVFGPSNDCCSLQPLYRAAGCAHGPGGEDGKGDQIIHTGIAEENMEEKDTKPAP